MRKLKWPPIPNHLNERLNYTIVNDKSVEVKNVYKTAMISLKVYLNHFLTIIISEELRSNNKVN